HEMKQPLDVFDLWRDIAVHRIGDVVHLQTQVIADGDFSRQHDLVVDSKKCNDVTGASVRNRAVQARQGANVNHQSLMPMSSTYSACATGLSLSEPLQPLSGVIKNHWKYMLLWNR